MGFCALAGKKSKKGGKEGGGCYLDTFAFFLKGKNTS